MIATIDDKGIKVVCQLAEKTKLMNVLGEVLDVIAEAGKHHFKSGGITATAIEQGDLTCVRFFLLLNKQAIEIDDSDLLNTICDFINEAKLN